MSSGNDPITREEFHSFMGEFAKQLNAAFEHAYRRFDDVEARMERLEKRMDTMDRAIHTVKNDTRLL